MSMNKVIPAFTACSLIFVSAACQSIKRIGAIYKHQCETYPSAKIVRIENSAANFLDENYWKSKSLFVDTLPVMEALGGQTMALDIRAFKHRFSSQMDSSTWVISYVPSGIGRNKETYPAPTIKAHNGVPITVTYHNALDKTLLTNPRYPVFSYNGNAAQKYYPIIYNVNKPQHVKVIPPAVYPPSTLKHQMINSSYVKKADGKYCKCPEATDMADYYGTTTHLHGAWLSWHSDGYPNSYFINTEAPVSSCGTHPKQNIRWGLISPLKMYGSKRLNRVTYHYPNEFGEAKLNSDSKQLFDNQGRHGAILWYHDHAMMRTATNVYCGLVGAYIVEGQEENQTLTRLLTAATQKPGGDFDLEKAEHDIPLLVTDKSFTDKGNLLYYNTTEHDSLGEGGTPEFFGNTIVVNGKVWPRQTVGRELYRYRVLNTSSSRSYAFELLKRKTGDNGNTTLQVENNDMVHLIGTEGGIIPGASPAIDHANKLILMPGERADIMINFTEAEAGWDYVLANFAKDEPLKTDDSLVQNIGKFVNTNFVMLFAVDPMRTAYSIPNAKLNKVLAEWKNEISPKHSANLISFEKTKAKFKGSQSLHIDTVFTLTLEEAPTFADLLNLVPRSEHQFWQMKKDSGELSFPMVFMNGHDWNSEIHLDPKNGTDNTYRATHNTTVLWKIINNTEDSHPLHIHLNRFQVIKEPTLLNGDGPQTIQVETRSAFEDGWKDVMRLQPRQTSYLCISHVLHPADLANGVGQFVYHCHILEHEDMSMMRRLVVKTKK